MTNNEKKEVLRLSGIGLGYREISVRTGMSVDSVRSFLRRNKDLPAVFVCEECGAAVAQNPGRKLKRFCSDTCRMKWWSEHPERRLRRTTYSHICQGCGKAFDSLRKESIYCCRACMSSVKSEVALK